MTAVPSIRGCLQKRAGRFGGVIADDQQVLFRGDAHELNLNVNASRLHTPADGMAANCFKSSRDEHSSGAHHVRRCTLTAAEHRLETNLLAESAATPCELG
jgi:hypothetical protein